MRSCVPSFFAARRWALLAKTRAEVGRFGRDRLRRHVAASGSYAYLVEEDTMYQSTTHPVIPSENLTLQNVKPPAGVGPAITIPRLPGFSDPIGIKAAFGFGLTFRLEPRFRST